MTAQYRVFVDLGLQSGYPVLYQGGTEYAPPPGVFPLVRVDRLGPWDWKGFCLVRLVDSRGLTATTTIARPVWEAMDTTFRGDDWAKDMEAFL